MQSQIALRITPSILATRIVPQSRVPRFSPSSRTYATSREITEYPDENDTVRSSPLEAKGTDGEEGAMSRRLAEMTEQSLHDAGGRATKVMQDVGFSEELISKLEERIKGSEFKAEHAAAFAQVNVPSGAGQGTRDIAAAQPWIGAEEQQNAVLRMLNDKHKPLRVAQRSTVGVAVGAPLPRKVPSQSSAKRLANARDRSSMYSMVNDAGMSAEEKEQMRKELKERFTAGARPMPTSIQGLATLANERIEDAIARGQFKNLPRGKVIERDYNASSPFLDTTEYFMNKIIQKQEIVPPWIEKQQELTRSTTVFRSRLRADWKRHAARVIASKGGSLEEHIGRAERYAAAEQQPTPSQHSSDSRRGDFAAHHAPGSTVTHETSPTEAVPPPATESGNPFPPATTFRDPAWERAERSYQTLSITNLNNLTRSYNLMAPDLVKKPYFSLDRELRACYADVAPQLANEIRERAKISVKKMNDGGGHRGGTFLERFGGGGDNAPRMYDSKRPNYGLRDFWRDLWGDSSGKVY